jgi:TPR repeat protein
MYAMGVLSVNSNGGGGDYAKAREWFQKAAEAGDLLAMNNLGVYFCSLNGTNPFYGHASFSCVSVNNFDAAAEPNLIGRYRRVDCVHDELGA